MATTSSSGKSSKLAWERFEELAKVAFVADPHADTRFFLKTRVVPRASTVSNSSKKNTNVAAVKIVARVSTRPRKNSSSSNGTARVAAQSITYQTPLVSNLSRLTRLLRFVMQEVLGPMKPTAAVPATLNASGSSNGGAEAAAPQPDASTSKKPKKSKSGKKKK